VKLSTGVFLSQRRQDLSFLIRLEFARPNVRDNTSVIHEQKCRCFSYSQSVERNLLYIIDMHSRTAKILLGFSN
jgi:hypothetical protein